MILPTDTRLPRRCWHRQPGRDSRGEIVVDCQNAAMHQTSRRGDLGTSAGPAAAAQALVSDCRAPGCRRGGSAPTRLTTSKSSRAYFSTVAIQRNPHMPLAEAATLLGELFHLVKVFWLFGRPRTPHRLRIDTYQDAGSAREIGDPIFPECLFSLLLALVSTVNLTQSKFLQLCETSTATNDGEELKLVSVYVQICQ